MVEVLSGDKSVKKTKGSQNKAVPHSAEKEGVFKELIGIVSSAGYQVRREKLKQGYGWKVISGFCRLEERKLIFVDQRLPQDEQIAFLVQRIKSAGISVADEAMAGLPPRIQKMLQGEAELPTAA